MGPDVPGWVRVVGGIAFSVAATLVFLTVVGSFPGMEVPQQWMVAGAICGALISAPVCYFMNAQSRKIAELHSDLQEAYKKLEVKSRIDRMTGLSNRENFIAEVETSDLWGWLVIGDIDHFKRINDTYGHQVGDEVLAKVGGVIRSCVRQRDLSGRLGGEEFGVFLPGASREIVASISERIRSAVADIAVPVRSGPPIRLTISLGIAQRRSSSLLEFMEQADHAMYEAKNSGRNRIIFAEVGEADASCASRTSTGHLARASKPSEVRAAS